MTNSYRTANYADVHAQHVRSSTKSGRRFFENAEARSRVVSLLILLLLITIFATALGKLVT